MGDATHHEPSRENGYAAGWYDDPTGLPSKRRWDGEQWTSDVRPEAPSPASEAPDGAEPRVKAEEVAPPGWYADPYGAPELRRWDGRRWTLEARPWPTPGAEEASPPALFNWPALVATLALAAGFVASWAGDGLVWFFMFLVMLFGGLGADEKYARRPGRHVALVLAVVGACLFLVLLIMGAMSAWEAVWKPA